uniref:Lipoprotein n=1 Tax=Candidatus Kentrum sp. LFY TaxID=2126342 RepID=A0A450WUX6_9GAMM|nr:MAG: hypothetical protein BECKLFY1418C_GA0070996_108012 [Candidatus Kentron sp. LFY]
MKKTSILISIGQIESAFRQLAVLLMVFMSAFLFGCSVPGLGVRDSLLMSEELPQSFVMPYSADRIWEQVISHTKAVPNGRVLATSPTDRIISWCERVENWRDLGTDTARLEYRFTAGRALADFESRYRVTEFEYAELAANTGEGIAITTIWIEAMGRRSQLHIRRVTYGDKSFAGIGHSRGDYEKSLYLNILMATTRDQLP